MARPPRVFAPGLLYHVIARGNHRQTTFLSDADYEAYLLRLAKYRKRYDVRLFAYCLMPNHVHLLLETSESPLSKFMQGVQQSYTQRFNRVYGKVGHLFQGRYKAIVCNRDEYLASLIRYIHLNPVRARLAEDPEAYPYSGHNAYLTGDGRGLIDPRPFLRMLGGRQAYRRFVLSATDTGHQPLYYETEHQQLLGGPGFAQRLGHPAQPAGSPRKPLETTIDELARLFATDASTLQGPDRSHATSRVRAAVVFVLVRRLGYRVADVAGAFARDASTITNMLVRAGRHDGAAADVLTISQSR
jgi:putative transposase